jgi:hypothetical protein
MRQPLAKLTDIEAAIHTELKLHPEKGMPVEDIYDVLERKAKVKGELLPMAIRRSLNNLYARDTIRVKTMMIDGE